MLPTPTRGLFGAIFFVIWTPVTSQLDIRSSPRSPKQLAVLVFSDDPKSLLKPLGNTKPLVATGGTHGHLFRTCVLQNRNVSLQWSLCPVSQRALERGVTYPVIPRREAIRARPEGCSTRPGAEQCPCVEARHRLGTSRQHTHQTCGLRKSLFTISDGGSPTYPTVAN